MGADFKKKKSRSLIACGFLLKEFLSADPRQGAIIVVITKIVIKCFAREWREHCQTLFGFYDHA